MDFQTVRHRATSYLLSRVLIPSLAAAPVHAQMASCVPPWWIIRPVSAGGIRFDNGEVPHVAASMASPPS